jgi:Flp pilus assembly protein TadD
VSDGGALARRFLELRRPDRALDALGESLDEESWALRAEAFLQLGRWHDAAESARRGLADEPTDITLLDLLALAEAKRGDLPAAERAIRNALELLPDHPLLLVHYGHFLLQGGEVDSAAAVLREAARIAPDDPSVAGLAVAYAYVSGRDRDLEAASRNLLRVDPQNEFGHRLLGVSLARRGNVGRAAEHLAEAVRQDPTDRGYAEAARAMRVESHWLLKPLWPVRRFGPGRLWAFHIAVIVVLGSLANAAERVDPTAGTVVWVVLGVYLAAYLSLALYSWLGAPLVRAWVRRRLRSRRRPSG